ncbi:unnamed protein product, partial [Mesorhabditis belari]|uniref:RRM domain-containing protein n=1 Tax=Mesorhabditis belari TaxID=2138241 RepID=A0AAF3J9N5_9BILA
MSTEEEIRFDDEDLHLSQASGDMDLATDFDAIERQMAEIEEEQKKLQQIQNETDAQMNLSSSSLNGSSAYPPTLSAEEKAEIDGRSVYVGNVDYGCTGEELEKHFHGCGSVSRVTILCDKYTGHPKGFAYVEFTDPEGMRNAMAMDESLLRGRQIKVCEKRTNKPGISTTNRPPRFRGGPRGRGGAAGGMIVKYVPVGFGRPRGRGLRRRPHFSNYA